MTKSRLLASLSAMAAASCLPSAASAQTEMQQRIKVVAATHGNVSIDLALTTKLAADEAFLTEDRIEAARQYDRTLAILDGITDLPESRVEEARMLREDVTYRKELLDAGFAFWGALYSTRPLNPVRYFADFKEDVAALESAVTKLQGLQSELAGQNLEQLRAVAKHDGELAQSRIARLETERAVIEDEHHERRERELRDRIARVQALQEQLKNEQKAAMAKLDQQKSATNALLMEGVGTAIGVPPELTSIANGGDVRSAIVSAGTKLIADPDFIASMGKVGEAATLASDVYARGQAVLDRVDQGVTTARELEQLVRKPTFEALLSVGAKVYPQLDAATRRDIEGAVKQAKPLVAMLELARSNAPVTDAVRQWIGESPEVDRLFVAATLVDTHRDNFAGWYTSLVKQSAALSLSGSALEQSFDQILRGWPATVYDRLPAPARQRLLAYLQVGSKEEALTLLRRRGIEALPISIDQGRIAIPALDVSLDLPDLAQRIDPAALPALTPQLESEIETGLGRLAGAERRILDGALTNLPIDRLEQIVGHQIAGRPAEAGPIFDAVLARSGTGAQPMLDQLAQLQAGTVAAADTGLAAKAPPEPMGNFLPAPAPASGQQGLDALNAALNGPLAAAFPQAKMAQLAVKWVAGNSAMVATIDQINDISSQIERYVIEEIHLRDGVEEAEFRQEISLAEQRIADERRKMSVDAARNSYDQLSAISENADTLRNRVIGGYRVANIFYLAERVRMQFDGLNRALRTWTGAYDQGPDFIRQQVIASPSQLRLALDPKIRLFDLLNDSDQARQRLDLDRLVQGWQLMLGVAQEYCREAGCIGVNPALGSVGFTPSYRLTELLGGAELRDFRAWQKRKKSGEPFRAAFLIHPAAAGRILQPPAAGRRVVRVVDLGVTTFQPSGAAEQSLLRFTHPGFGYIEGRSGFYTETLTPARGVDGHPLVAQLAPASTYLTRWSKPGGHSLGPLEGYALFTEWLIELPPVTQNWSLSDVELKFVYQYQNLSPASEREARSAMIAGTLVPMEIPAAEISTIGSWDELGNKVDGWMASDPPWKHGPLVREGNAAAASPDSAARAALDDWISP